MRRGGCCGVLENHGRGAKRCATFGRVSSAQMHYPGLGPIPTKQSCEHWVGAIWGAGGGSCGAVSDHAVHGSQASQPRIVAPRDPPSSRMDGHCLSTRKGVQSTKDNQPGHHRPRHGQQQHAAPVRSRPPLRRAHRGSTSPHPLRRSRPRTRPLYNSDGRLPLASLTPVQRNSDPRRYAPPHEDQRARTPANAECGDPGGHLVPPSASVQSTPKRRGSEDWG